MPSYLFPFPASRRSTTFWALMFTLLLVGTDSRCFAQDGFTNWESPHVHPLDLTPSEERLLAVNTPDARLEVFDVSTGTPVLIDSIPVGLDPVSVRARTDSEVWVVNHVSDSVSIVDLELGTVVHTLETEDEPADVVFAANGRAFVSCSQANSVLVFDAANRSLVDVVPIAGEDPRALAVSPNGNVIYCAIFESGNASTLVRGG
ncbi:MAG: beta-propeller fold lactonase family protein, partial [Planctomycetota bacterium]